MKEEYRTGYRDGFLDGWKAAHNPQPSPKSKPIEDVSPPDNFYPINWSEYSGPTFPANDAKKYTNND